MNPYLIYPRPGDKATVYLKNVITNPAIQVGDFTMYHDFRNDPRAFQENNVLYHYPVNGDRLVMGKFCSIACGAVFLFTSANHALGSLSTYPFPIFFTEWGLDGRPGTTRGTSSWATTCGWAMRPSSCLASPSGTGPSSVPGPW